MRAQTMKRYNPTFIPINLIQYLKTGAPIEETERKLLEHVEEGKEHESMASTAADSDDEEEQVPEDGVYLG